MGTELTDPHKIDLWETMLSHCIQDKTKPKRQQLGWAILCCISLARVVPAPGECGNCELCLKKLSEALRKFLQNFFQFSSLFDVQTRTTFVWYWISLQKNGSVHLQLSSCPAQPEWKTSGRFGDFHLPSIFLYIVICKLAFLWVEMVRWHWIQRQVCPVECCHLVAAKN